MTAGGTDAPRLASGYDAVVIGAGANGLTAAATLARAGRRVLVVERDARPGGRSAPNELAPGFRAPLGDDTGWLPPSVARELGLGTSGVPAVAPAVAVSVADGDGGLLSLPVDRARAEATLRRRSPRDAARWGPFAATLRNLAGFLEALYQLPAPDVDMHALALGELLPLVGLGRKLRALGRHDMVELLRVVPMPVQDLLDDAFESAPLKAAVAAGGVRDLRQGPRSGGTAFVLLHHLVGAAAGSVRARPWWREGPDAFAAAAEGAARRAGAVIVPNAEVARVVVRDDAVAGVALANGDEVAAPVVLSTADPARTLLRLVDPVWLDPEFLHAVRHIKLRGSTAVVHYALDRLPAVPGLDAAAAEAALAGPVTLTPTMEGLERAYDAAKYGTVAETPHVEITVPSLRWPSLAPAGKHVAVATARFTPYRLRDDTAWDADRARALGAAVTAAVARAMPGFADAVLHQQVLTPPDLEARFGVTEGALTHGELTLDQILFMRPVPGWGRHAMPIAGLYLGGAGTHPGPGVVGGPGWLAARRVLADGKRRASS